MAEDKRTKIGPTGPVRVPAAAPAEDDPSKHATTISSAMPAVDPTKSYLPPVAVQVDPLIGMTLAGRYLIQKKLGEGGMGAVYAATHQLLEKQVALKVLHNEFARKNDLVERFMQEAKAASRIRHENVIDISDFGSTPDGIVFFAMELLKGHDLHEEVARARLAGQLLPYERSKKIFLQICAALSAAHGKGIIHRDLKPENVYLVEFLGDPDFVKLLDFGIAKMTEVSENDRKLTKTGMLFGTPEYMSPEQARGEQVDHRVDVYAMGCILFQLVTGRVPFEAENFMGVLSLHLTEPPPMIPEAVFDRIGAPRELAQVIDTALAKDRGARWQTIDDFANAVRTVSGEAPVDRSTGMIATQSRAASVQAPETTKQARVPTPPPITPTTTPVPIADSRVRTQWTGSLQVPEAEAETAAKPRSKLPLILGAVAVVAAAGLAVFFVTRTGNDTPVDPGPGSPSAPSGSNVVVVTPDAPPAVTVPVLPEWAMVKLESVPKGAEVTSVATGEKAKTPHTFKVRASRSEQLQFKFTLKGYGDAVIAVIPDRAQLGHTETLVKGAKVVVVKVGSGSSVVDTPGSAAVNPPDPVKPDAGVTDDCPELPCGIKTIKCTTKADCTAAQDCVDGSCK
ncbi:MAG: serine/threonine-protein kinase [Kofleriaceae bacterium]